MTGPTWIKAITDLDACSEAVEWASAYPSAQAAWDACECVKWMCWWLERTLKNPTKKQHRRLVLMACDFADEALPNWTKHYPDDDRPKKAIDAARAWANEPSTARAASAARVASATWAAWTWSAARIESAASAASTAWAESAASAGWAASNKQHADIIRSYFPRPPMPRRAKR